MPVDLPVGALVHEGSARPRHAFVQRLRHAGGVGWALGRVCPPNAREADIVERHEVQRAEACALLERERRRRVDEVRAVEAQLATALLERDGVGLQEGAALIKVAEATEKEEEEELVVEARDRSDDRLQQRRRVGSEAVERIGEGVVPCFGRDARLGLGLGRERDERHGRERAPDRFGRHARRDEPVEKGDGRGVAHNLVVQHLRGGSSAVCRRVRLDHRNPELGWGHKEAHVLGLAASRTDARGRLPKKLPATVAIAGGLAAATAAPARKGAVVAAASVRPAVVGCRQPYGTHGSNLRCRATLAVHWAASKGEQERGLGDGRKFQKRICTEPRARGFN